MSILIHFIDVGGKSKSDRKGGRMLMMKNRLISNNNGQINHKDIIRSGAYQSAKHGSIHRETTPIKTINAKNLNST